MRRPRPLSERYPPSPPCGCAVCRAYCRRPGWWTVAEAEAAIMAGLAGRMMLEMAEDFSWGVLAPAFPGCEGDFALEEHAGNWCGFLADGRCDLHGTGLQPLECRFCHHERAGRGARCHEDIGRDWKTDHGRSLIVRWSRIVGFWERRKRVGWAGEEEVSAS